MVVVGWKLPALASRTDAQFPRYTDRDIHPTGLASHFEKEGRRQTTKVGSILGDSYSLGWELANGDIC